MFHWATGSDARNRVRVDVEGQPKRPLDADKPCHRARLPSLQGVKPLVGSPTMAKAQAPTTTGERITQMREAAGLSKRRLSKVANVDQRNLIRWENGTHEPMVASIRKLIPHIGGSIEFFLGDGNDQHDNDHDQVVA